MSPRRVAVPAGACVDFDAAAVLGGRARAGTLDRCRQPGVAAGLDPECAGVTHVLGAARRDVPLRAAPSSSFAFGGSNAVLAFRALPD